MNESMNGVSCDILRKHQQVELRGPMQLNIFPGTFLIRGESPASGHKITGFF